MAAAVRNRCLVTMPDMALGPVLGPLLLGFKPSGLPRAGSLVVVPFESEGGGMSVRCGDWLPRLS